MPPYHFSVHQLQSGSGEEVILVSLMCLLCSEPGVLPVGRQSKGSTYMVNLLNPVWIQMSVFYKSGHEKRKLYLLN